MARMAVFIVAIVSLASTASANPVAPRFVSAFELAFINFPINGIVLLVLFTLWTIFNRTETPMGGFYYFFLILLSVLVITLTGAVIDAVVFEYDVLGLYVVGLLLIASICTLVAYFALRMEYLWSLLTGAVFFTVNAITWYMLPGNIQDSVILDNTDLWWWVILLYLLTALVVSYRLFGRGTQISLERRVRKEEEDREVLQTIGKMEGHIAWVFFMLVIAFFFFGFMGTMLY